MTSLKAISFIDDISVSEY